MSNVLKNLPESIENSKVKPNSGIRYISSSLNYLNLLLEIREYKKEKLKYYLLSSEPESSNHPLSSDIGSQSTIAGTAQNQNLTY